MPDIPVGAQVFDLVFHPTHPTVYTGLLTGQVKSFSYDDQGSHKLNFSVRPSKRSCRGLTINEDGSQLWAVGKGKALYTIDTTTAKVFETRSGAHESPINRVKHVMPWLLSTGDDDGVIKLWDPRQQESIRSYTQHFDYITDFLWLDDKKHLVATSGDGTLSVMDIRSKKTEAFAQSEDQEDELLSIVAIKGASKIVVGTQIGVLSIFNRSSGWGDCVDRVPGHPHSVDALCILPPTYSNAKSSTILTGSSDGFIRAVDILPTELLGVVADHGEFPVERIALGRGGGEGIDPNGDSTGAEAWVGERGREVCTNGAQGERWWVGSVGHEEVLRMTDLGAFFADLGNEEDRAEEAEDETGDVGADCDDESGKEHVQAEEDSAGFAVRENQEDDSDAEWDAPKQKKRKRKQEKDPLTVKKKKGRNEVEVEGSFFDEL